MCRVERSTRLEPDDERLPGLQQSAPIEQVAQAAAAERLDDPEDGRLAAQLDLAPVEHRGDVGVGQGVRDLGEAMELAQELGVLGVFGTHDLDRDLAVVLLVDRVDDDRVRAGRDDLRDSIAPCEHGSFEHATARRTQLFIDVFHRCERYRLPDLGHRQAD